VTKRVLGLLVAVVATAAAAAEGDRTAGVTGSGRIVEEVREISGFSAIRAAGSVNVTLKAAAHDRVTVKADDNVVPWIETRLVPGDRVVLEIGIGPVTRLQTSRTPEVTVEFRAIEDVSMHGSGDLRAEGIRGERFALSLAGSGDARITAMATRQFAAVVAGSGDVVVSGQADEQAYRLDGSGDVGAGRLRGRSVTVAIAGSGDAVVNASEALTATIEGSGDVVYSGTPRIVQRIDGSGRVRRRH
jgi:hypothetical protein